MRFNYLWDARADHDNPYYQQGADFTELNRNEGNEVKFFINHLGNLFHWAGNNIERFQKLEVLIKRHCPSEIRSHLKIEAWVRDNWKNY